MNKKKLLIATSSVAAGVGILYGAVGKVLFDKTLTRHALDEARKNPDTDPEVAELYANCPECHGCRKWFDENSNNIVINSATGERIYCGFIDRQSDVYVIVCHGYTSSPRDMALYARRFADMGYNVLLPAMRAHGKSEHKICTMGWLDRLDVIDWINYINSVCPKAKIVLHGVSMGSATVMNVTGENLPSNVKCAVADCGYTSVWDVFSVQVREQYNLPPFPFLNAANTVSKLFAKFDFKQASPLRQVKKSSTPTLFIHGDRDDFVPFWMLHPIYEAASCEKQKLIVSGALHAVSAVLNPELYWSTVEDFIGRYL